MVLVIQGSDEGINLIISTEEIKWGDKEGVFILILKCKFHNAYLKILAHFKTIVFPTNLITIHIDKFVLADSHCFIFPSMTVFL